MSFMIYDIIFMVLFIIAISIFLYVKRNNLNKEGILYLYRTSWGLKLIDKVAKKYKNILKPLQYVIIALGPILMIGVIFMFIYTLYIYIKYPIITDLIKAPPVVPLIPYFPKIFGLNSFFPDFPFISFLFAILIVAISHEFSHGIFARLNKIRIKSTGFAFAGPILTDLFISFYTKSKKALKSYVTITIFIILLALALQNILVLILLIIPLLGAFVEQDDNDMNKRPKFAQLSVLGAGVFANMIMSLLFLGAIWLFFIIVFTPGGYIVNDYAKDNLPFQNIEMVNGLSMDSISTINLLDLEIVNISYNHKTYYTNFGSLKYAYENDVPYIEVYDNSPAYENKILDGEGASILYKIDGEIITSLESLRSALDKHKPGDMITLTMKKNGEYRDYALKLAEREGRVYLGISSGLAPRGGLSSFLFNLTPKINNLSTGIHHDSLAGEFGIFIFYLLWWILLINFLVALFNMLPLGILDGGRFFMLSIWGLTGSKKIGERAYKYSSIGILIIFILIILVYLYNRIL